MAIIGVTEFKAEFGGMLDLHKRFGFNAVFRKLWFLLFYNVYLETACMTRTQKVNQGLGLKNLSTSILLPQSHNSKQVLLKAD